MLWHALLSNIRAIRTERWAGFTRARRVLELVQALRDHPSATRSTGLAIGDHSGMGKTRRPGGLRRSSGANS
ncbi:TniB family NTP-binding protein (plasmid) [Microvirga sp. RSM25]|uniref:TniB family NTP-binding protein n=1 Tax=Microvirga sp. RSM25 TaxID=3273802 RepID=UPI0038509B90